MEEHNQVWKWETGCILPELPEMPVAFYQNCRQLGPMILTHRCIWLKPDQAIQIGSGPVLHDIIQAFFGRTELNWMQEV